MVGPGSYPVAVLVEFVIVLRSPERHTRKAAPVFEAFDSVDAQHGLAELRMQLVKHGLAKTGRCVADDTRYDTPDRIAIEPYLIDQGNHLLRGFRVRATHNIVFGS